nr:multidrug effflux MFS transporter [Govania unica]
MPSLPSHSRRVELAFILGALTAFAPLSIDMYLPSLPTLERIFATDAAAVQRTLSTFFVGFAIGQAFYGPLIDRFGRKLPLYGSLGLYILASIGCVVAPSIEFLAGMRLFQALGACAGVVIARAVVRDLFTDKESIGFYASLMLVSGLAPMLAPILGGFVLKYFSWEANFVILAIIGVMILLLIHFRLPETLRPEHMQPLHFWSILRNYGRLLTDREYIGYGLGCGFAMAGLFSYIAAVPFILISLYKIAPEHFGFIFALNAFGFISMAQVNGRLLQGANPKKVVMMASIFQVCVAAVLLVTSATGFGGLYGILVPLFFFVAPLGFIMPNSTVLAMAPQARNAGVASALLGLLQNGLAAVSTVLAGIFSVTTPLTMAVIMGVCAVGTFVMLRVVGGVRH